jgi:uncharacterized protein
LNEYRLLVDGRDISAVRVASSYPARLRGLLGTSSGATPLLLTPANSVHGWGMTYPLDIAQLATEASPAEATPACGMPGNGVLGAGFVTVRVVGLRPWGLVGTRRGVRCVLEAPRGAFAAWGLVAGSRLRIQPSGLETTVENGA